MRTDTPHENGRRLHQTIFSEEPHRRTHTETNADAGAIPCAAVTAGAVILENGGETYRAEETAVRVAYSLGAENASAFVTPTVVIVSAAGKNGRYYTLIRRITRRGVNLTKIANVNALSRRLAQRNKQSSAAQTNRLLSLIAKAPENPPIRVVLAAGLCSMFFALMFGGSLQEAAASCIIGMLLRLGLTRLERLPLSGFTIMFAAGIIIAVLCEIAVLISVIPSSAVTMTAVLMQVVPGLAIVNAIRDLIAGDLVSGVARATEAFMTAAGLSIGAAAGIMLVSAGIA